MTRKRKIITGGLVLLLLFVVAIGFFFLQMAKLNKSQTDFVERPDVNMGGAEDLDKIDGTPEDIDEDYYKSKYREPVSDLPSIPNQKFAKEMDGIFR